MRLILPKGLRAVANGDTQVLVEKIGQEMSGFSLMSEAYAQAVLVDPGRVGLIAHELAHQWWGNSVTCASTRKGLRAFFNEWVYLRHDPTP